MPIVVHLFSGPVHLRMLNDDESCKLLEDIVFGKESCSPPLEKVGQQIAKMCWRASSFNCFGCGYFGKDGEERRELETSGNNFRFPHS